MWTLLINACHQFIRLSQNCKINVLSATKSNCKYPVSNLFLIPFIPVETVLDDKLL